MFGEWDAPISRGFWDTNRSPNHDQTTRPSESEQQQRQKRTYRIEKFALPADYRVDLKENENRDGYLEFAR